MPWPAPRVNFLDLFLNCACLLLWLNWRSSRLTDLPRVPGIALVGTLKLAARRRADRWPSSVVLAVVLFLRALLYWQLGSTTHWTPTLSAGPISLHFRSDMFTRMFAFSLLGFLLFVAVFYFSLLLVAGVNRREPGNNPWHALVRAHLGVTARLPGWLMLLSPFIITFLFWMAAGPVFGALDLMAPARSFRHLAGQSAAIGLSAWLLWPYVIAVLLILHISSSYLYLGKAPFWKFVTATTRNLLQPLAPLRLQFGKIDLAPLLMLVILSLIVVFAPGWLTWLYTKAVR
jgi:uncharacterized protein YggT (Ycf19 family)